MIKIGLDIDDVLASFLPEYLNKFGNPKNNFEITKNVEKVLKHDREFWLSLPVLNTLNFEPALYCTKRVNCKTWTKKWLENNNFPNKPVYQVICQCRNKADFIKGRVDVFVDDSITNFIQMNLAGVPCLLLDKEYNQDWGPIGRIYSLDVSEIEDAYKLFMDTVFPNFKNLL
jgi:hypothetical protein